MQGRGESEATELGAIGKRGSDTEEAELVQHQRNQPASRRRNAGPQARLAHQAPAAAAWPKRNHRGPSREQLLDSLEFRAEREGSREIPSRYDRQLQGHLRKEPGMQFPGLSEDAARPGGPIGKRCDGAASL